MLNIDFPWEFLMMPNTSFINSEWYIISLYYYIGVRKWLLVVIQDITVGKIQTQDDFPTVSFYFKIAGIYIKH